MLCDMALRSSSRGDIAPFYVMEVMRAADEREAAGGDVLHLEVGQPATAAPSGAREAAHRAIDAGVLGYTSARGILALRERLARHYLDWYNHEVDPDHIVITQGASGAFTLAFLACFDVGARVVVPSPGYPCYRNTLTALGVEVIDLPVGPETRFQPAPEQLDALGPIDGLVVASPSNPTGTMLLPDELSDLVQWCRANDVRLVSDEIYHGITYGTAAPTAIAEWSEAVVVNSFSKYFSMTGWRLGWLVLPPELVGPVERLAQNATVAAPTISQHAALGAFDSIDELESNIVRYRANRQILLDGLPTVGLDRLAPADGAFYIYANVDHITDDSQVLARQWLLEHGIAATPGIDFDPNYGHKYIRFSFAGSSDDMRATIDRLSVALT
jgi:aspartate/methionine/tyrosine aminotransferase